jgi:hypothetical protein
MSAAVATLLIPLGACDDDEEEKKESTQEKLDSDDAERREEGVDEDREKYEK